MFNDRFLGLAPGIAPAESPIADRYHPSSVMCRPVDGVRFRLAYLLLEFVLDDLMESCSDLFQWLLTQGEDKKTVVSIVAPRLFVSQELETMLGT